MEELVFASATTLARKIRARATSAHGVAQAHLRRIAQVNSRVNAVAQLAADHALRAAGAADAALARGQPVGALHGVPFTVKDRVDTVGLPCTGGDPRFRDRRPDADATVAARMRLVGAIVLGKTNVMVENLSMFKARFTLMVVLIATLMVVAQPRCTWACSCIPLGSPQEERERAVAVFSGRVETLQPQAGGSAAQVRVTFAVSDVWKGDAPATTVVETTSDSASCGFNFEAGQEYIVYANAGEGGVLSVSLCSRTQLLANAQDDLAALGEEQAPAAETPEPVSPAPLPTATHDPASPWPIASPSASPTVLPDTAASSINLAALVVVGGMGMLAITCAGYMLRKRMS